MYFAVLFVSMDNCVPDVNEVELVHTLKNLENRSPRNSERSSSTYQELRR